MSKNLVSMAQQFSGLPMDSLIGGPLNAAAKANAGMALTQTHFLLNTCFNKEDNGGYKPIMINMELERGVITPPAEGKTDASIQKVSTKFNLPLLTILPLNSLAVDDVSIGFEMEVKSSYGEEESQSSKTNKSAEIGFKASVGIGPFSASVTGKASYSSEDMKSKNSHYEKSNSAKYTVSVHAGQLPLPQGVTTIIQAFANAIEPVQLPAPGESKPN